MNKKYTIFIIDDKIENLQYLSSILEEYYDVRASLDSKLAIDAASLVEPNLILLDIMMPDIDGFEVCKLIKENQSLSEIPVIFISAMDDIGHKIKAFDNGGVDYITKPFEPKEVIARVKMQLEIYQSKKVISESNAKHLDLSKLSNGIYNLVILYNDIRFSKKVIKQ